MVCSNTVAFNISDGTVHGAQLRCAPAPKAMDYWARIRRSVLHIHRKDEFECARWAPLMEKAGFLVLSGNLFDMAIMKTSVISEDFANRFLRRPGKEGVLEGRAIVFDGSDDYHHRIDDRSDVETAATSQITSMSVLCTPRGRNR